LLEDILKKNIGEYYLIRVLNENELAIIMSLSVNSTEDSLSITRYTLMKVREEFQARYHIAPLCGIGSTYTDVMDIHYSFNEAKQALYYYGRKNISNDMVIWYDDINKDINLYYYPNDLELKLINFAKSGNWNELESALNKIYDENFVKNPIDDSMRKLLFYDMQATLLKIIDDIQFKLEALNQNFDLLSREKPEIFFKWLKETYYKICKFIIKNKKSHNIVLKENILEYIDKNYTDGNLSVCLVASYFNLSESYFSQFFKEQIGDTFSSYIEKLRIGLACNLIKAGTLSVDQIAQKTGYNNTNSFRRAFKKVTGVVPSAFK
jgi:YesN/AraC family two-component response regulator